MSVPPIHQSLNLAIHALVEQRGEDARRLLIQLIHDDPSNAAAHYLLGAEMAQAGEWSDAERHLKTALVMDPSISMARFQLAQLLLVNGRYPECIGTLQPLVQSVGALGFYARALIAIASGDESTAEVALEDGLAQPQEQEALAQDMQRLLVKLREDRASVSSGEVAVPIATMLLSNYMRYN